MSAEVAVDGPPGLQQMGCGFGGPPLSPLQESSNGSTSPPKSPGDTKDELIREVTDAVREHIEWKTSAAVDVLWQRGQRALQQMQQNQLNQTATLRAQLEAHADTQKKLERDNAMLRQALEALVTRLSGVLGQPHAARAPPQFPPPPQPQHPSMVGCPPHLGLVDSSQASAFAAAAALVVSKTSTQVAGLASETAHASANASSGTATTNKAAAQPAQGVAKTATAAKEVRFDCNPDNIEPNNEADIFHTPAGSPQRAVAQAPEGGSSTASAVSSQLPSVPSIPSFPPVICAAQQKPDQGTPSLAPTFSLILRRADNVPLGLDVRGDASETCLVVESVRAGGAVEAWNKQCPDDNRAIKAGDHIVKINAAEDSDSMRDECVHKHLLRITVMRGGQLAGLQVASLRADADEFVPRVHPVATSSC